MIKLTSLIHEIYDRIPYGGWMDTSGKFYPVFGYQEHDEFAEKYCFEKGIELNVLFPSLTEIYRVLYLDGFIRIVIMKMDSSLVYNYKKEIPPNHKQLSSLKDTAIELGLKTIVDDTTGKWEEL